MRVAVYGLGYVGSVTAACLADAGHEVIGIDVDGAKVAQLNAGVPPVLEAGLDEIVRRARRRGRLQAVVGGSPAPDVDVHLVCVGTPSSPNGALDTTHVADVADHIASALAAGRRGQVVVVRSTVLPGTVDEVVVPRLEVGSGLVAGTDFGVAMCPEFLRETTAVADFFQPPFTVAGADDEIAAEALRQLFGFLDRPFHVVDVRTAETVKYACNAFHAVKVAFANEVGRFARSSGADAVAAMEIFCADDQLNISPAYLRPGFAFGGSCLPKDLRALVHRGRQLDLDLPLLGNVLPSNEQHLRHATDLVMQSNPASVAMLGLAFKTGTDDLRESPYVDLAETLIGKGIDVRIWDPDLRTERLTGQNRTFVDARLPHLARLLCSSPEDALDGADVCVVGSSHSDAIAGLAAGWTGRIVDLTGAARDLRADDYAGVAW